MNSTEIYQAKSVLLSDIARSLEEPIHPLYHSVCFAKAEGFESMNVEVAKGFNHVNHLFDGKQYTLVIDRGYDSNKIYEYIENQNHHFITRLNDRRYLLHKNKRIKVPDLANRRKGKINFSTTIKGTHYDLKASHIEVRLPVLKDTPLYMVYGYGKKPMKLLKNLEIKGKPDVLRVLKEYITRWRIEELFRVQKQEFGLEKNSNPVPEFFTNFVSHHELPDRALFHDD